MDIIYEVHRVVHLSVSNCLAVSFFYSCFTSQSIGLPSE